MTRYRGTLGHISNLSTQYPIHVWLTLIHGGTTRGLTGVTRCGSGVSYTRKMKTVVCSGNVNRTTQTEFPRKSSDSD